MSAATKTPRFTDQHRGGRYRSAAASRKPGYLARRLKAYARLARMQAARRSNVTPIRQRKRG